MEFLKINNPYIEEKKFNNLLEVAASNSTYSARGGNSKCFIHDDYAILKTSNIRGDNNYFDIVIDRLNKLKQEGVNVVPILGYAITKFGEPYSDNKRYDSGFIIQEKALGEELFNRRLAPSYGPVTDEQRKYVVKKSELIANAPQQHFDKWVSDFKAISDAGIEIDPSKQTNFFYDKEKGFSFIDLNYVSQDNLFTKPDLLGNQSHREFIRYCLLPIINVPLKNFKKESIYLEDEKNQIINSAAMTYSKIYNSLIKIGISKKDIEDVFVEQKIKNGSFPGFSLYDFKNSQEILDYNRIQHNNENIPGL